MTEEADSQEREYEGPELRWLDLRPVYDAPDEPTAIHVHAFLRGAGIDARIQSAQIPGFDGAFAMARGFWGRVVVPMADVVRAKELVAELLAEADRPAPPEAET